MSTNRGGLKVEVPKKNLMKQPIVIQTKPADRSSSNNISITTTSANSTSITLTPKISQRAQTPQQPPPHFKQPAPQTLPLKSTPLPAHTFQPQSTSPNIPHHDAFCRLSLLSFISSFEDQSTFNETDLTSLGLDLKCQEPLLPLLHSVLSEAPLLDRSRHPIPDCYSKLTQVGKPQEKLSLFSDQTLLFIFYTYPRDQLQIQAANELKNREYVYDAETERWKNHKGCAWSVDQWKELDDVDKNESVIDEE